jgi:hypothetical protein
MRQLDEVLAAILSPLASWRANNHRYGMTLALLFVNRSRRIRRTPKAAARLAAASTYAEWSWWRRISRWVIILGHEN